MLRKSKKSVDQDIKVGYVVFEGVGSIFRLNVDFLNARSSLVTESLM